MLVIDWRVSEVWLFSLRSVQLNMEERKWRSESEVAQSCPTLCDPIDYSLPRSSIHGISQARILEWVAIPFSRGSSWLRDQTRVSCSGSRFRDQTVSPCFLQWQPDSLPLAPPGTPPPLVINSTIIKRWNISDGWSRKDRGYIRRRSQRTSGWEGYSLPRPEWQVRGN